MPRHRAPGDLEKVKIDLDEYGFVIIENLLPPEQADRMCTRAVEIREVRDAQPHIKQKGQGLLHDDDTFYPLVTNPVHHELVRYKLGDNYQLAEVGALLVKPGSPAQRLHADAAERLRADADRDPAHRRP